MKSSLGTVRTPTRSISYRVAILAVALCALAAVPLLSSAQSRRASIRINNKSKWDIHHLYLSPTSSNKWGPDQLGDDVLESGGSFTLTDIPCGEFDIKVVDNDGDACVIDDIPMCQDHSVWDITNQELLTCEGFGD
jgi:hypothetical protein